MNINIPQISPKTKAASTLDKTWLVCCQSDAARRYTQKLAALLTPDIGLRHGKMDCPASLQNNAIAELVVYEEPPQFWLKQLLFGSPASQVVDRLSTSALIIRQPRWPLQHILFVTRGRLLDYVAVRWLGLLVQAAQANVTVLTIQPRLSMPNVRAVYGGGLATWLATDTPLGHQLRSIVKQTAPPLQVDLRFRPGYPPDQMKQEVAEHQPDLVVMAADPSEWYERRLLGDLVSSLFHWIDRPVLIVKGNS